MTEIPDGVIVPPGCTYEEIALDDIEATAATQVRVRIDRLMVEQYTEDYKNGANIPPLDVFRESNSERNILADGFHRHRAGVNADYKALGCIVHPGGMLEALTFALGSNAEHGFRRTNADKRHAVEMALKDPELGRRPAREIADICRVTVRTVNRIINEQLTNENDSHDGNESQDGNDSHREPASPKPDDYRDNGKEPTQEDVDLESLRQAVKVINTMPYNGKAAAEKLALSKDDVADCELASTWLADVVIITRNRKNQ